MADLPRLSGAHGPRAAYHRAELPERVLQFGTGMLLRAVCAASVDAANAAGAFGGRIVVVQSTPQGQAAALNAQDGLFTLVERGLEHGAPVERTRLVGSIARALVAETQWDAVRDIVARPELRVIVSNVTEAGFRLDAGFPARLTDLLHTRFARRPDGPPVFVIPTELVDDNGPRLAAMVEQLAEGGEHAPEFRDWLGRRVRFCSSLVDRITTGTPAPDAPAAFARTVLERFRNPWLDHEWRVIATNQTAKLRLRVAPVIAGFARKRGRAPQGLALACAAYLQWARSCPPPPGGDVDLPLIERHWRAAGRETASGPGLAAALERLAASALGDASLWGGNLAELPGLVETTTRWLLLLEREGVYAALDALRGMPEHSTTGRTRP